MKLLVIAAISIGGFILYQMLIGPVRVSYQLCIAVAQDATVDDIHMSCGAKRQVYEELTQCIETVQSQSNINSILYSPFGFKAEVDTLLETHNKECPNSKVKLPQETLYISG